MYVKHLPGARIKCMKDYLKPSLREDADDFILHAGVNNLNKERQPELIAKLIIDQPITSTPTVDF